MEMSGTVLGTFHTLYHSIPLMPYGADALMASTSQGRGVRMRGHVTYLPKVLH